MEFWRCEITASTILRQERAREGRSVSVFFFSYGSAVVDQRFSCSVEMSESTIPFSDAGDNGHDDSNEASSFKPKISVYIMLP